MRQRFLAEFLGTFILVFAGTGAIIVNQITNGVIGHAGVALTFGLVVAAMIHTFGDISGAHLNPAVSISFAVCGRFPYADLPAYISAQLLGALCASSTLKLLFPTSHSLGMTLPSGAVSQSFFLEIILTTILMLTILSVSHGPKEKGITAGIAIGAVVGLEAMFAGPISGASMNPARSLGPAIISGNFQHLWLYPCATILGGVVAIPLYEIIRKKQQDS
jgi:aquaporin Z